MPRNIDCLWDVRSVELTPTGMLRATFQECGQACAALFKVSCFPFQKRKSEVRAWRSLSLSLSLSPSFSLSFLSLVFLVAIAESPLLRLPERGLALCNHSPSQTNMEAPTHLKDLEAHLQRPGSFHVGLRIQGSPKENHYAIFGHRFEHQRPGSVAPFSVLR